MKEGFTYMIYFLGEALKLLEIYEAHRKMWNSENRTLEGYNNVT